MTYEVTVEPFDEEKHADLLPPDDHHNQKEYSGKVPFVADEEVPQLPELDKVDDNG